MEQIFLRPAEQRVIGLIHREVHVGRQSAPPHNNCALCDQIVAFLLVGSPIDADVTALPGRNVVIDDAVAGQQLVLEPCGAVVELRTASALEAIGSGYWDCLDSTWLVVTEKTPVQIKDELKQHLKDDDLLLVMRYGEGAAWLGFKDECRTWLEDKL